MPKFHLKNLNRKDYITSTAKIQDAKTQRFANMSLEWWDRHFSWNQHGCVVLLNEKCEHLSYIFYKIDRYNTYLTIHNIFTPLSNRRNGYAHSLLDMVFDIALANNVSRFNLSCVSQSLDFYLSLGFVYWGLNTQKDYYCDMPIPAQGLDGLNDMVNNSDVSSLIGPNMGKIYTKIQGNTKDMDEKQLLLYENDKMKMGESYMLQELTALNNNCTLNNS
jgi:hypothetical protein